ncbi:MAG: PspC domain-containing protein [Armatimonadetes bacterium]|nr:PspC domain-containing protein [Armatimonadota bacterium]
MKKLHISHKNKMLTGVCGGLSESFGINAMIIRLIFIITLFFGGTGIIAYLILFAVLPKSQQEKDIIDIEPEPEEEMQNKIYRKWDDRMIAGVCSGIAQYLNWDVSLIRIAFLIMSFIGGVGVVLYAIFWFMFPNEENI